MKLMIALCAAISLFAIGLLTSDIRGTFAECSETDSNSVSVNNAANANSEGEFTDGSVKMTLSLTEDPTLGWIEFLPANSVNISGTPTFNPNILTMAVCDGNYDFTVSGQLADEDVDGTVIFEGRTYLPTTFSNPDGSMHVNHG